MTNYIEKYQNGDLLQIPSKNLPTNYLQSSSSDRKRLLDEERNRDRNKKTEDKYQRWKSTYKKGDSVPAEYQDRYLKESVRSDNSFKTQLGEALQLPLRYITAPDKLVGDAASAVAPNSWAAKNFDNTYKDRMQHREVMANPKYSTAQKMGSSWSEGAAMTNMALAGELGGAALMKGVGYVAPKVIKGVNSAVKKTPEVIGDLKSLYYNKAPWTWKPNPDNYYRTSRTPSIFSDIENTNLIRAVSEKSPNGEINILTKRFPEADTYWAKGTPLDGKYSTRNQNYGNYVIEASNEIPFVHAVNQRTKQVGFLDNPDINYNHTHKKEMYVKPRESYGYDELGELKQSKGSPLKYNDEQFKALYPHWFYGYKEIKLNPK